MKKFLGFLIVAVSSLLPFAVNAEVGIDYKCGAADANGNKTCVVSYNISEDDANNQLTITLTEEGGAEIIAVNNSEYWTVSSSENNNVWTVLLTANDLIYGEGDLFSFTYNVSGQEGCKIRINLNDKEISVENNPVDEPADDKQTGATLPYIALGTIALTAGGAYIAIKNKSKMYKI